MSKIIWEDIYNSRKGKWGDFPPEDLIRFIRRYKKKFRVSFIKYTNFT